MIYLIIIGLILLLIFVLAGEENRCKYFFCPLFGCNKYRRALGMDGRWYLEIRNRCDLCGRKITI